MEAAHRTSLASHKSWLICSAQGCSYCSVTKRVCQFDFLQQIIFLQKEKNIDPHFSTHDNHRTDPIIRFPINKTTVVEAIYDISDKDLAEYITRLDNFAGAESFYLEHGILIHGQTVQSENC